MKTKRSFYLRLEWCVPSSVICSTSPRKVSVYHDLSVDDLSVSDAWKGFGCAGTLVSQESTIATAATTTTTTTTTTTSGCVHRRGDRTLFWREREREIERERERERERKGRVLACSRTCTRRQTSTPPETAINININNNDDDDESDRKLTSFWW